VKRKILAAGLFLAAVSTASADSTPRIFVHMMHYEADRWGWLTKNEQICGAHIVLPWRPIDNGSGAYDWSSVEKRIAPWAAAGKTVGLTFAGVDEGLDQEGPGNTTLLATPDYVMKRRCRDLCADDHRKARDCSRNPDLRALRPGLLAAA
jgi:hypothetical protein